MLGSGENVNAIVRATTAPALPADRQPKRASGAVWSMTPTRPERSRGIADARRRITPKGQSDRDCRVGDKPEARLPRHGELLVLESTGSKKAIGASEIDPLPRQVCAAEARVLVELSARSRAVAAHGGRPVVPSCRNSSSRTNAGSGVVASRDAVTSAESCSWCEAAPARDRKGPVSTQHGNRASAERHGSCGGLRCPSFVVPTRCLR